MAYHGYIPEMHKVLMNYENPKILEIGVSAGITTVALFHRLSHSHRSWEYTGVDIWLQPEMIEKVRWMGINPSNYDLRQENSLKFLEETNKKYDIVLIDGDHNYYTVKRELQHLNKICHDDTVVICDDYSGMWSETDLFYGEKEEFKNIEIATKRIDEEKQGVKPAIDEFVKENEDWVLFTTPYEPVFLTRRTSKFLSNQ